MNQDLSDWKTLFLENKNFMFTHSVLERNNKLPYCADIETEFMPSTINSYELNQKLNQELNKNKNKTNKKSTIKV